MCIGKKACVWMRRDGWKERQPQSCFCGLGFLFLLCFYAEKISLSFCRLFCLFTMNANGSQLYAGRDFYHWTSYEELNFNFTTFLSYEARYPCLRIGDVMPSPFFCCHLFCCHFLSVFVERWLGGSFAKLGLCVALSGFANVPPIAEGLD